MSIVLKKMENVEDNTKDFGLDFPLATAHATHNSNIISSQSVCFQCALLLERSIYQEHVCATLPIVSFEGPNKDYIINQLYLALTAGLATGAPGAVQLFAAILDITLQNKSWCTKVSTNDVEIVARRSALEWLLNTLLKNCPCREDFASTGKWIKYPQALQWAATEFLRAGLDSWIIQYPVFGFTQLLRWYEISWIPVNESLSTAVKHAKLINLTVTKIMVSVYQFSKNEPEWTRLFLPLIYADFNAVSVPKDLGKDSIVSSDSFWSNLRAALGADKYPDARRFLMVFDPHNRDKDVVRRVQMVIFWALYHGKGHSMPKTFFADMRQKFPLAVTILHAKSKFAIHEVDIALLSIFRQTPNMEDQSIVHGEGEIAAFASPYGPSVVKCGQSGCGAKFYMPGDRNDKNLRETVRARRAKHLFEAYAVADSPAAKATGLPERTLDPGPPSSRHCSLHVSTARKWSKLPRGEREPIMLAVDSEDEAAESLSRFVDDVCEEICHISQ